MRIYIEAILAVFVCLAAIGCSAGSSGSTAELQTTGSFTQEKVTDDKPQRPDKYVPFFTSGVPGPVISGLQQGAVPQGLAYYAEKQWLVVSAYRSDGKPGILSIIDAKSDKLLKTLILYQGDNTPYKGHAGGLAISDKYVWLGGESTVWGIPLDSVIKSANDAKAVFQVKFRPDAKATFMSYSGGMLWAGDYYDVNDKFIDSHRKINRDNITSHAWAAGYKLDPQTGLPRIEAGRQNDNIVPDQILSLPDKIQGFAIHNGQIALSQSAGRTNDSTLLTYKDERSGAPHQNVRYGDKEVPLWFLDSANQLNRVTMPPLSEGLAVVKDNLAVVFESGAMQYRVSAKFVMDQIYYINPIGGQRPDN
ncbi:hypothetical protein [Paenibacillus thalictri]|uniref:DUF5050 domain-containing protein n=1 Tax=Paenibacillus thalictri TaxID=2527873 RepID=A0A4Q9DQS1_9BACL|nr:hypothetical protein [Paenibacillus thalictri]TBL78944.1 hypothetical protein EYB31_11985 [Paenibacillus thalictri]